MTFTAGYLFGTGVALLMAYIDAHHGGNPLTTFKWLAFGFGFNLCILGLSEALS